MHLKKAICLFLFATAIFTTAVGLDRCQRNDWGKTQADGGAPTPPPIPWPKTAIDSRRIIADGGAPTPPPIPWPKTAMDSTRIIAEGGAPPAPPIPWGVAGTDIKFLRG